jgi:hypothetical protein
VRQLAVAGPDAPGAPQALVEALGDGDDSVKKVAVVGVLSFGDKALALLRKKVPPRDTAPSKIPNPEPAPLDVLAPADIIVYFHPWFDGMILPACEEVAHDRDPALRLVAIRALVAPVGPNPQEMLDATRKAADGPDEQLRAMARDALKQFERVIDIIRAATDDPDERVREAAKEALKRLGD